MAELLIAGRSLTGSMRSHGGGGYRKASSPGSAAVGRQLPIRRACRCSGKTGTTGSGQFRNRLYRTQQYREHALPVIPEQRRRLCQSGHQQHCTGKLRSGRFHQGSRRSRKPLLPIWASNRAAVCLPMIM